MKNRNQLLNILFLLPLVLLSSPNAYPQGKDPSRDLAISWSSRKEPDPGSVFGSMTNRSANNYPCVRIEFELFTRFDLRKPGEQSQRLGVFPVEVSDVTPRSVRKFDQRLPYPAGMGVKSVSECQAQSSRPFPSDLKVLSFTITPAVIQWGQTATLQWQTENAQEVVVGERNPELATNPSAERILMPRTVESSGSLQVKPLRTTTYSLKATKGPFSTYARSVTVTVTKSFPSNLKILSFTISPITIQEGQTVTLQWQTENAEKVVVGERNPALTSNPSAEPILMPRTVEAAGFLSLAPTRTTTYSLMATKGAFSTYARSVTVTVADPPQGFCTIFGKVSNDQRDYATTIGIYRPGESDRRRVLFTKRVRLNGDYSIPNVPVGEYDVIPRGLYPSDRFNIGPNPRAVRLTCRPARSHRADFTIRSNEG